MDRPIIEHQPVESPSTTAQNQQDKVMIWKEFQGYQIFFVIFVVICYIEHGYYFSGSGAQVLIVIYFKLH